MITLAPLLFLTGSVCILVAVAYASTYSSLFLALLAVSVGYVGGKVKLSKLTLLHSLGVLECYLLLRLLVSGR